MAGFLIGSIMRPIVVGGSSKFQGWAGVRGMAAIIRNHIHVVLPRKTLKKEGNSYRKLTLALLGSLNLWIGYDHEDLNISGMGFQDGAGSTVGNHRINPETLLPKTQI